MRNEECRNISDNSLCMVCKVSESPNDTHCSSLHTADVGSASVTELRYVADSTCSTDRAGASMSMHTCILICVIVEPDSFSLCSGKYWASNAEN